MKYSSSNLQSANASLQFPLIYCKKNHQNLYTHPRNSNLIRVNLADTQYPIIEQVCQNFGWKIQYTNQKQWDIKWTDSAVSAQFLSKMSQHQKVNHFPGMNVLSRKNTLTKNINRMQQIFQQQYSFYPRAFLLPYDWNKLKNYYQQSKKRNIQRTFIVKPQASCQGRGIFLTQDINDIDFQSHCVVQKYIANPLLYKNLKFDLRVYALIAGCDPLRIYIYNQGLTRFATEKYQQPDIDNLDNLYMHLTNYAINKDHPNYVYNDSINNLSYGHKKSLAEFFKTLKTLGFKAQQYWSDIKDIIIKTMISGQPHLQHEYRTCQPHNLANNMCFQVLGFDFMIDDNQGCYLLEINHTPSFTTDTPFDQLVKSNIIRDTLTLMNINVQQRDRILYDMKTEQQKRVFTGKSKKYTPEERQNIVLELQRERDQYEKQNLGSYQKIYPCKNIPRQKKYQELLIYSLQSYKQTSCGGSIRQRQNPSRFRVKKIITNQSIDDQNQYHPKQSKNQNKNVSKHKSLSVNPHSSNNSILKSSSENNRKKQLLNQNGILSKQNVLILNPQQIAYIDIDKNNIKKLINPMLIGSIISRPIESNQQSEQTSQNTEQQIYENNVYNKKKNTKQMKYSHLTTNQSYKNYNIQNQNQQYLGDYLKTRQQQSTMFVKILNKGHH